MSRVRTEPDLADPRVRGGPDDGRAASRRVAEDAPGRPPRVEGGHLNGEPADETADAKPAGETESLDYKTPATRQYEPDDDFDTGDGLKSRFITGSVWSGGGFFLMTVIRLGGNLILARLLAPEYFGIVAIVHILTQGLQMFSDIGIGPSIIQHKRGSDPVFLDTAFTLQIARGVCLFLASCALAWPVAWWFGDDRLLYLVPVGAITALLLGFQHTAFFTENRKLNLGWITSLQVGNQLVGVIATILYVELFGASALALIVPGLIGTTLYVGATHFMPGADRRRLAIDAGARRDLISFGKWIFLSTILTFLAMQGDRLILGTILEQDEANSRWATVGIYGIALMMSSMPMLVLQRVGSAAVFPVFSRLQDDPKRFASVYGRVRQTLLVLGAVATAGLVAGGPPLIEFLYPPEFHPAGAMLQLLAIAGWFQVMWTASNAALLSLGKSSWLAAANTGKLLALVAGLLGGHALGGRTDWFTPIEGAIYGVIASEVVRWAIYLLAVKLQRLPGVRQDVIYSIAMAASAAAAITSVRLADGLIGRQPALDLLVTATTVLLLWAGPVIWQLRRQRAQARQDDADPTSISGG